MSYQNSAASKDPSLMVDPKDSRISLVHGDICTQNVQAIVNAANELLSGGLGVDGAIHQAAGPKLDEACENLREQYGPCPTGKAVITPGFDLPIPWIIHAVGPIWGQKSLPVWAHQLVPPEPFNLKHPHWQEDWMLSCAYEASITLAWERGISSVAFPNISTGIYGFPKERAAKIALQTVRNCLYHIDASKAGAEKQEKPVFQIRFVCFEAENYHLYKQLFLSAEI